MRTLHTLNHADQQLLQKIYKFAADNDIIVLIENGVQLLRTDITIDSGCEYYALEADLEARNVQTKQIKIINDNDFVKLSIACDKMIAWTSSC